MENNVDHRNGNDIDNDAQESLGKSGISYELILSPAVKDLTPLRSTSPLNVSIEQIEEKLRAAEKRRESLDAKRMETAAERQARLDEAAAKRQEYLTQITEMRRGSIEKKLAAAEQSRTSAILSIVEKIKDHEENIQKVKRQAEEKQQELSNRIERKLELVAEKREEIIQRKVQALKEHDRKVEEIHNQKMLNLTQSPA